MAGSNLTGSFIANTYQKLLQVDTINGATGVAPFIASDVTISTKYNLLNGLGQTVPYLVLDQTSNGNGGIWLKDNTIDPGPNAWGIQIGDYAPFLPSQGAGLNFWRPFGSSDPGNYKLFLKNTGTTWIGFNDNTFSATLPNDVRNYSLYVKDGIQVGQTTYGKESGRINIIGDDPLENGSGMFINGEHPFKLVRYFYDEGDGFESFRTRYLKFPSSQSSQPGLNINNNPPSNEWISEGEWTALVVGFARSQQSGGTPITNAGCLAFTNGGYWKIGFSFANITGSGPDQDWLIDVLFIKKGFFSNLRPSGPPSSAGSISNVSKGGSWT